jgi:ketosteroid isomerase-like protein
MSAALELVKIALQAYGTGDCEITMQLSDPLIRWDERASRPDGDLVWGQDEVLKAMRRYQAGWAEYRFEVEKIAEVGPGRIVGLCRERGQTENNLPVDRRYGGLWVVENGKIASWATYLTPKEAVRAARELAGGRFTPAEQSAAAAEAKAKTQPPQAPAGQAKQPKGAPPEPAQPSPFDEKRRDAAKRRAALAKAAREGARRTRTG